MEIQEALLLDDNSDRSAFNGAPKPPEARLDSISNTGLVRIVFSTDIVELNPIG